MRRNAVAWAALVVSVAGVVGSRVSTKPVTAVQEIPAKGQETARALSDAFGAVADFVRPSVVQISVQKKAGGTLKLPGGRGGLPENMNPKDLEELMKRFFGPDGAPKFEKQQFGVAEGTGSGFVYDDRGHILTNNHVVSGADKITVTFHDGETAAAKVVGTDPDADVAVIKVDATQYRPLPKGQSSKLRVGEWVIAVGSPFGLEQTVTAGIISATERGTVGINKYESFLQTDAAINPGNSGGPLVDMNGRVVGINSAIATMTRSSAGVGFAIPMDMAQVLADKLIKDGKVSRARVGLKLKMDPLTPSLAKKLGLNERTHGIIVDEVAEGSPGSKAGIKNGDVIVEFDGRPVSTVSTFRNLVSAADPGKSYAVKYFRGGKEQVAQVAPAPEKEVLFAHEKQAEKAASAVVKLDGFGLSVQAVTAGLASQFGYPKDTEGLLVTAVKDDSPAAKVGLEPGDVVTKVVKDKKIQPLKSVGELVAAAEGSEDLALFVKDVRNPEKDAQAVTLSKKSDEKKSEKKVEKG
ncbi:MAG: htrA 1 [Planctomycetota bacterium]|nr:htrA 1 [Planctomycetota bacterium]